MFRPRAARELGVGLGVLGALMYVSSDGPVMYDRIVVLHRCCCRWSASIYQCLPDFDIVTPMNTGFTAGALKTLN